MLGILVVGEILVFWVCELLILIIGVGIVLGGILMMICCWLLFMDSWIVVVKFLVVNGKKL